MNINTISFADIYYPLYSDPRYNMLHAIRRPIQLVLYYAKLYNKRHTDEDWRIMHDYYEQLKGTLNAFDAVNMIDRSETFRIPCIVYRTALKIACGR